MDLARIDIINFDHLVSIVVGNILLCSQAVVDVFQITIIVIFSAVKRSSCILIHLEIGRDRGCAVHRICDSTVTNTVKGISGITRHSTGNRSVYQSIDVIISIIMCQSLPADAFVFTLDLVIHRIIRIAALINSTHSSRAGMIRACDTLNIVIRIIILNTIVI